MLIELYREMRDKYGFNGGACVPQGVEKVRDKIIELINDKLPKNSKIEAYAYDRAGLHNWCLIMYRNKKTQTHKVSGEPGAEVLKILYKAEEENIINPKLKVTL